MTTHTPSNQATVPQDWAMLRIDDPVKVIEPQGHIYDAVVDCKAPDSSVIWVRRPDINTRHLIEYRDGVRIRPCINSSVPEPRLLGMLLLKGPE